jgi:cobalt-precorrin 5A hydrolase
MRIAIICVNKQGDIIADKLEASLKANIYTKTKMADFNLKELSGKLVTEYDALIFITSTGIAVRAIAPFIDSKASDPAVVVIDCTGKYAISLLSGHIGGANALAIKVGDIIGAQAIITTATDNLGITAPDSFAKDNKLVIDDLKKAKEISALLVAGEKVAFIDEDNIYSVPKGYTKDLEGSKGLVYVTNKEFCKYEGTVLKLIRKNIILGIGCRKAYDIQKMRAWSLSVLEENNIDISAVRTIATVEIKKHEPAIVELAKFLKCDISCFGIEDIKVVQNKYPGSDFVEKTIGVRAVCEPCVELAGGSLITGKLSHEGMTLCIGKIKKGGGES